MGKFRQPTPNDVVAAMKLPIAVETPTSKAVNGDLGPVRFYDPLLAKMAASRDTNIAPPLMPPRKGDWLSEHTEKGQSFVSFLRAQLKAAPHASFNTVALVILGRGLSERVVADLGRYVAAFYQLEVALIGPLDVESEMASGKIRSTVNEHTGQIQMFCHDAMIHAVAAVKEVRELSRKVVATMAVTMIDLTPNEEWNFVYGQASLTDGRGVFSLARFSPEFNDEFVASKEEADQVVLERACKVVTHELGHIFGLKHCIYFTCLMGGVNHVGELVRQPLLLCPACLQKLIHSFHWDLKARYEDLARVCEALGLREASRRLRASHVAVVGGFQTAPTRRKHLPASLGKKYFPPGTV